MVTGYIYINEVVHCCNLKTALSALLYCVQTYLENESRYKKKKWVQSALGDLKLC